MSTKTKYFSWKLLSYTCLSKEDLFLGIILQSCFIHLHKLHSPIQLLKMATH
jgi:hypothetical protein